MNNDNNNLGNIQNNVIMDYCKVHDSVLAMTLGEITREWKPTREHEDDVERIWTSYTIAAHIEEMVDASLEEVNSFMFSRGYRIAMDECGNFGWRFYTDNDYMIVG